MKYLNYRYGFSLSGSILVTAILILSGCKQTTSDSPKEISKAVVLRTKGEVQVKNAGSDQWITPEIGSILNDHSIVKTGPNSWGVISYRKAEIQIGADSLLDIGSLSSDDGDIKMELKQGFSWFNYDPESFRDHTGHRRVLQVVTPVSVASVRGTKFSVRHDDSGSDSCVCHGEIETAKKNGSQKNRVSTGSSVHYLKDNSSEQVDLSHYFKKMKVSSSFIKDVTGKQRENFRQNCLHCHELVQEF